MHIPPSSSSLTSVFSFPLTNAELYYVRSQGWCVQWSFSFSPPPSPSYCVLTAGPREDRGELPFSLPAHPPPPPVSFARYLLYYSWVTPKEQEREGGDG